ncbi:hypothetical protein AVEN_182767-1 [Araneus ventricosus]|uniref:Receptor ligand binding region domain-containing protein n=1 Tax=Araneus ventricosus TaxID=182803 RepID=A0A4Y2T8S4_ARAVE|nr:hypothetical protein AVEN_182767-1 [Araneus ventricosus]
MVQIIQKLNWTYISILYEESNYGIQAFTVLEELLSENDICIAVKERLTKDSGVAGDSYYDSIVQKLMAKPKARDYTPSSLIPREHFPPSSFKTESFEEDATLKWTLPFGVVFTPPSHSPLFKEIKLSASYFDSCPRVFSARVEPRWP